MLVGMRANNVSSETTEGAVWELISALLKDPERLRAGLEELIEQERAGTRGDPDREANSWLEKPSEVEQERRGYLRLAAKGHMSDDDLAEALSELEETCTTAERELKAIRGRIQNRQKTSPRNTSPGAVPF